MRLHASPLPIDLATVFDAVDVDRFLAIRNAVQETVVANPQAIAFLAGEFHTAVGARFVVQALEARADPRELSEWEIIQIALSAGEQFNLVHLALVPLGEVGWEFNGKGFLRFEPLEVREVLEELLPRQLFLQRLLDEMALLESSLRAVTLNLFPE